MSEDRVVSSFFENDFYARLALRSNYFFSVSFLKYHYAIVDRIVANTKKSTISTTIQPHASALVTSAFFLKLSSNCKSLFVSYMLRSKPLTPANKSGMSALTAETRYPLNILKS